MSNALHGFNGKGELEDVSSDIAPYFFARFGRSPHITSTEAEEAKSLCHSSLQQGKPRLSGISTKH